MSSAHDGRAPVPLGLLAAMRAAVVGLMLAAGSAFPVTPASTVQAASSHTSSAHTAKPKALAQPKKKSKIKRSKKAKADFKRSHPCPAPSRSLKT